MDKDKRDKQAAKVCPPMSADDLISFTNCKVEGCAWWSVDRECCGMLPYKEIKISGAINTHEY